MRTITNLHLWTHEPTLVDHWLNTRPDAEHINSVLHLMFTTQLGEDRRYLSFGWVKKFAQGCGSCECNSRDAKKKKSHPFTALLTHSTPVGVVDAVGIYPWKLKQKCLHGISGCLQMLWASGIRCLWVRTPTLRETLFVAVSLTQPLSVCSEPWTCFKKSSLSQKKKKIIL